MLEIFGGETVCVDVALSFQGEFIVWGVFVLVSFNVCKAAFVMHGLYSFADGVNHIPFVLKGVVGYRIFLSDRLLHSSY